VINTQWQDPGFNIVRAAHAELFVRDLARSRRFYVDLLGLAVTDEDAQTLYLRGYEEQDHHSLVLRAGAPHVGHLAFRVGRPDDLPKIEEYYTRLRRPTRWARDEEVGQTLALRVQDELGFPFEFFYAIKREPRILQRFDQHRGAHIMRMDHFNLLVPDAAQGYEAFRALGFRCSEYTVTDPPDARVWAAWMYRKPGVHDVALMNGVGPRLHHVGLWASDMLSILRACDILAAAGQAAAIERGPGRHGLSNAFFLYLRDPDGHRVELFTGDYYTGDPDFEPIAWSVHDPRRGTFWGHAAPASWFEEASTVLNLNGQVVETSKARLTERPQTVT
jgi:3,4-dihydroxyphenylacetate 2,3-dioxygenase